MKDEDRNAFINHRDQIRLLDEQRESLRRRKVASGVWTEEDSHATLRKELEEAIKTRPEFVDDAQFTRDFNEIKDFLWQMQTDKSIIEKEYIFDESLGQNLKDHVEDIKTRFPDLEVLVRRDRDGYPIVKTQYKPKYKYNLDDLESYEPDAATARVKESLDDVLRTVLGGTSVTSLDKKQLEEKLLQIVSSHRKGGDQYELDEASKNAIKKLYFERVNGRFKEDREGFAKAYLQLCDKFTFDEGKKAKNPLFHNELDNKDIFNEMYEERDLMVRELTEQLTARVKRHLYQKERKASDFTARRLSETSVFENQVASHDRAIKNLENSEEGFDKEAY